MTTELPEVAARGPAPPPQPGTGPGGADYVWGAPTVEHHTLGRNRDLDYWTYEPANWAGPGPRPATAPIVVFNHGWMGNKPSFYAPTLTHLARKGNIVIFPKYQHLFTWPGRFTPNAIRSTKAALRSLLCRAATKPDPALGMQVIGHSAGGLVSVNMSNRWQTEGLPRPNSIVCWFPWDGWGGAFIDASLSGIPSTTVTVGIVGDEDRVVGRRGCDIIWDRTDHIQDSKRAYVRMFSDRHGEPPLVADHTLGERIDALHYCGVWKLADAARACGTPGGDAAAMVDITDLEHMGSWSDGVTVRKLRVTSGQDGRD